MLCGDLIRCMQSLCAAVASCTQAEHVNVVFLLSFLSALYVDVRGIRYQLSEACANSCKCWCQCTHRMLYNTSCGCCVGGDNIGNGNQVADGAVSLDGKASSGSDSTSGGQANGGTNSITGRRSLLTSGGQKGPSNPPSSPAANNIACSTGFVAVKSGVGSVCVQQADGKLSRHTASRRNCSAHLPHGQSFCEGHWQSMRLPDRAPSGVDCTPCCHCMLPLCLPACQPMQPASTIPELC